MLEACGLAVQLVNASQARNLPGRSKTDKLDAQWLARLTEMGLLRTLVRAAEADPGHCGTTPGPGPGWPGADPLLAAAEKLLEGALVKLSCVASS